MKHYVSEMSQLRDSWPWVFPVFTPYLQFHPKPREVEMSDLEGNFDVVILGTGLVESIAAAYVMQSCPMSC